jgi:hypothetical protein
MKLLLLPVVVFLQLSTTMTMALTVIRSRKWNTSTNRPLTRRRMAGNENDNSNNNGFRQAVMDDAKDALQSVGWSKPSNEGELTSEDPFVQAIDAAILAEMGVGLDELLNPAKVRTIHI